MEKLIGIILGIIIAIVAIGLLIGLILLLLQIIFCSLPAWGIAICLILLFRFIIRIIKIYHLNSKKMLARIIKIEFNGNKLDWCLDESQIETYVKLGLVNFISIILGITSIWLITKELSNVDMFKDLTFWYWGDTNHVSSGVSLILSYILSGIIVALIILKFWPGKSFKKSVRKRANVLIGRINISLEKTEELLSLETSIKSIINQLRIHFPIDFQTEIQIFVDTNKSELLFDTTKLNKFIKKDIEQAKEYLIKLEKANNFYKIAMKLYTETSREVNKTGSIPLIKELEYDYEGLNSTNLKSLLTNRKWDDFNDIVNSIIKDLERLRELAIKYQKVGYEEEPDEETEEEKAYRILGIPHSVTNDQIKKTYRTLASIWHPDAGLVKDDTRVKEINWAYEFLSNKRKSV